MKSPLIFTVFFILFFPILFPAGIISHQVVLLDEPPSVVWSKTYGGSVYDYAMSVEQTMDHGYIIAGYTNSYGAGDFDAWLIKTDSKGNEVWNQTYGGVLEDIAQCIIQTSDGCYVVAGYSEYTSQGNCELWILKIDENGTIVWDKKYRHGYYVFGFSIIETNKGFVVVSEADEDIWLVGLNENGDMLWNSTIGGMKSDQGTAVIQDHNGGYVIVGTTFSYGNGYSDIWLVKTNETGVEVWNTTFGGIEYDTGGDVIQLDDGGFVITGGITPHNSRWRDICLIRTNENGTEVWNTLYGGSDLDYGKSIIETSDGNFLIAGITHSYPPKGFNGWVIQTDKQGYTLWDLTIGGDDDDWGIAAIESSDDAFVIAGKYSDDSSNDDASLVKIGWLPRVSIVKPQKGLYVIDSLIRTFLFRRPVIVGHITVEVNVVDNHADIEKVEFYINDNLILTTFSEPYIMLWSEPVFGGYEISVIAYNSKEYKGTNSIQVWKFF